jgi:type VI secretion system protein ImpA
MVSMSPLNLGQLTAPIPGASPVGHDLRAAEDSLYHDLRFLRTQCREEERQFEAGTIDAPDSAKWEELARGCERALGEQTKDLEIACWLLEAMARVGRDGATTFAGLRDGFKLLDALCAQYWDGLFSVQDDSDPEAKFAPIQVLDGSSGWISSYSSYGTGGTLVAAIRRIPLTPGDPPGPFSFWQIQQRDKFQMAEVYAAARQAGLGFFQSMAADIQGASAAADALEETLSRREDEATQSGGSRTRRIREALYESWKMVGQMSSLCDPPSAGAT